MLDATVARFAPTSALWLFDPPAEPRARAALSTDQLTLSLRKTLDAYPQLAGQLRRAPFKADDSGDHTQRHGRLRLTYGSADDPGVELVVARFPGAVAQLAPSATERASRAGGWWDAGQLPSAELLCPDVPLALHDMSSADWAGLPCMLVQLTIFDCGGLAIGLRFPHALADAQTLLRFVHDWAAVNRAMAAHAPLPELASVFDPQILDRAAAGDIDAARPDPALVAAARALPLHRYDWWASARGCPAFLADAARVPAELDPAAVGPLGVPLPWAEWDLAADVAHHVLYFGADEVHRMWEAATASTAMTSSSPSTVRVSHLDALLSHVWALIMRARGLGRDEEAHLDVTLGLRGRLAPPLPDAFLGSPIVVARVTATGGQAAATQQDSGLGAMAAAIRTTLGQFNAATLPALLHEVAHEAGAQRLWHAFLGRRHTIVTSWLRLDVYGVDFVGDDEGAPPRYVEAVMPSVDGCVQVMEAGHNDNDNGDAGTSVSLHLAADVMNKLLHDPLLRKFAPLPRQEE